MSRHSIQGQVVLIAGGAKAVALQGKRATASAMKNQSAAALSPFSKTGLADIEDVIPFIRHRASDGRWVTGQTILINSGHTTE